MDALKKTSEPRIWRWNDIIFVPLASSATSAPFGHMQKILLFTTARISIFAVTHGAHGEDFPAFPEGCGHCGALVDPILWHKESMEELKVAEGEGNFINLGVIAKMELGGCLETLVVKLNREIQLESI